jgi:hypothetical protein
LKLPKEDAIIDFGGKKKLGEMRLCFSHEGRTVNLMVKTEGNVARFDFNFHFDIGNLVEFKEKMADNPILELKQTAVSMMRDVFELKL